MLDKDKVHRFYDTRGVQSIDNRLPYPLDIALEVVPTTIKLFSVGVPVDNLALFVRSTIHLDLYFGRELFPILPTNRLGLLLLRGV